ncbi:hypothetical protein BTA51_09055 [Hahella sp. CCB-MM4]|uniref:MHYT domain-containing protein n=1 Tax=Hahella sp. (strain CCB-MM4) TaxID=1926491 RepID=UPI000B9B9490|nr:MHYT domain-containing protein [Hahella sp. CCB-MM4]OZG73920.1 hypothetical protein BTA51_09055 [Hahella sp. CCB-MM4]
MNWLTAQFQIPANTDALMQGSYNPWLVTLSVIMAIGASFTAYQTASRSWDLISRQRRKSTLFAASLAMGGGVWTMHFIGMLAFEMDMSVSYDPLLTLISMLPSIGASWIALNLIIRRSLKPRQLAIGGTLFGLGIGVMHYTGMAAMTMPALLRYDPYLFFLSIVVAILLSIFSVRIRFGMKNAWGEKLDTIRLNLISGCIMGLAISGMHYTGMAAARFIKPELMPANIPANDSSWFLVVSVTSTAFFIILLTLAISLILKYKDISEESRFNERRLRAIMDTAVDGIVTINSSGIVIGANQAVESILGWSSESLKGQNVRCLMPEPHHSEHDNYLGHYLENGTANIIGVGREVEARHRDGRKIPVRLAIGHVRLPKEDVFVAFISDISKRIEMEQDLIRAKERAEQAAISRAAFLANMSHEIRTPMNAIIGFSDVLMETPLSDEQHQFISTIGSSARSLLRVLNDVLDSAKLDKGKLEIHHTNFSLTQEVDLVISTLALQASRKGLDLCVSISSEIKGYYIGDPDRIRQVLTNIVGNAIKFTDHGRIDVTIEPSHKNHVLFQIADTGIGMTPQQLEHIFDPFTQADASTSRRFGGSGLGTTISKQLVELMGGSMQVTSELDVGTCFEFTLPLQPGEEAKQQETEHSTQLPPLKILVVDDIQQNIDLLTLILSKGCHQIIPAKDGQEAFQCWEQDSPDVILMDIQMPVMDGLSACRAIRQAEKIKKLKETPIIAITASVLVDDQLAARNAGMNGFAAKPVEVGELSYEIARVLGINTTKPLTSVKTRTIDPLHTIDIEKGLRLWGERSVLIREIQQYLEHWALKKQRLFNALKDHNSEVLQNEAHALRGVSGNLAMTVLSNLFDKLEQYAKAGRLNMAESVMAEIQANTDEVVMEISLLEVEEN